jgi:ABC-2 type transport system permease protein
MLIPLSVLPAWVGPIAWVLAPTWGMRAVRHAAIGGDVAVPLLVCAALSIAYAAIAAVLLHYFERLARDRASLSLT